MTLYGRSSLFIRLMWAFLAFVAVAGIAVALVITGLAPNPGVVTKTEPAPLITGKMSFQEVFDRFGPADDGPFPSETLGFPPGAICYAWGDQRSWFLIACGSQGAIPQ